MSSKEQVYVLDSFAVLSYLQGEMGMDRIKEILRDGLAGHCRVALSVINLGEVLYITERKHGLNRAQEVLSAVVQLPVEILPASTEAVLAAAHVKAHCAISYADCFAVAAANELNGTILTGDPEFGAVSGLVRVEWLRSIR